ncbi:hypothetical protein [Oceanicoccus sagamiensis]|uniref:hypothetical protein n=1 Tax=Oceanicoccus sagamiensis TaxID=716816 RepID=UPI003B835A03
MSCGLNRVARLMREAGLQPKSYRKFRVTTDSRRSYKPARNLLDRAFRIVGCLSLVFLCWEFHSDSR